MIANTQRYEQKVLRSQRLLVKLEFVDRRSQLMKLRMESTVSENGRERNFPATVPPIKIKERRKSFLKKIMAVDDKYIL
jgi:hypothetical protein